MEVKAKIYKKWTPEERGEMLLCIAYGYTISETAEYLGRTHAAVDTELKDVRDRHGACTLPQMIFIAIKEGIIDINEHPIS